MPFEGGDLRVRWGAEDDVFDPLTPNRASFCGFRDAGTSIKDVVPTRSTRFKGCGCWQCGGLCWRGGVRRARPAFDSGRRRAAYRLLY